MHPRTISDLKRLGEISNEEQKLYKESKEIKENCVHQDYVLSIEETMAFEFTPLKVCVVCRSRKGYISLEDKITCLRDFFTYDGDEKCSYTDDKLLEIAKKGGINL